MEAAVLPIWLQALEPLSVPFVILLMLAGWLWEVKRDRDQGLRYDARLRARAYALAAILNDWIAVWPGWAVEGSAVERVDAEKAISLARELAPDGAEIVHYAELLVEDAPYASDDLAQMAREIYARLLPLVQGIEGLSEEAAQLRAGNESFERGVISVLAADRKEVGACYDLLQPHIDEFLEEGGM